LENDKPIVIFNCIKKIVSFTNAYITYRIMLTNSYAIGVSQS